MQKHSLRANEWADVAMEKYLDTVYRLAYARTGNRMDAEDVTQNVMLKLLARNPSIESEAHLKHWLIRVTVNESIGLFRSAWRRLNVPLEEARVGNAMGKNANNALDAALSMLSPRLRVVIHLFYYEDMSTQEIADILGIRPEAVRERLHRARQKLKRQLEGEGGDVFV